MPLRTPESLLGDEWSQLCGGSSLKVCTTLWSMERSTYRSDGILKETDHPQQIDKEENS